MPAGTITLPPPKLVSSVPGAPVMVTVSDFVTCLSPAAPRMETAVGSECGVPAGATTVSVDLVWPVAMVSGENDAVAWGGRPAGDSVTAPSNPAARVSVTSIVALSPVSTGSLSDDSASSNDAVGIGIGSGSPGSAGPPPEQASVETRTAVRRARAGDDASCGDFMTGGLLGWVRTSKCCERRIRYTAKLPNPNGAAR